MQNFIFSVNVVLPLIIMMSLGWVLKYLKVCDENFFKTANKLTFKLFLPLMLFNNIYSGDIKSSFNIRLIVFVVASILITVILMTLIVPRLEKQNSNRGVLIQALFRSNYILFGVPVCMNLFGQADIGITSMLAVFVVPLYNFLSVVVLFIYANKGNSENMEIKKTAMDIVKNPLILACVIGIATASIGIKLPNVLEKTITDISKIATPFALIILGGDFGIKDAVKNIKYIVWVSVFKLIVIPGIIILSAILIGFRQVELGVLLSIFASPIAIASYIMAQNVKSNDELAGQLVATTTILSSFTIFFFILILKNFSFI
ncbi:AEC family transporter [Clostridium bowmanii]|uniref:AEC family transporter n=1 Tax=Clostridium bowmanii TaxID=132925 RepID=UPI001C0D9CB9|nr:AEC family transporter [Clostridium bowmanii]MBU3190170.1 AEC family transporter [Clostridium bowmanii]MCA1074854.1 AEC family transporter [Clostridium bowmanii]